MWFGLVCYDPVIYNIVHDEPSHHDMHSSFGSTLEEKTQWMKVNVLTFGTHLCFVLLTSGTAGCTV